ncbi:MAG: CBS domain-containing protein [Maritimibacter sp.]
MSTIEEITQRDVLILTEDTPIRRAVAQMVEAKAAAALVSDDSGRLVGILTQKDCFRPALHASYYQDWDGNVGDFMTKEPVNLPVSTNLVAAAEAFQSYPHREFPVLDGEKLVGLLHRSDVLAQLLAMS